MRRSFSMENLEILPEEAKMAASLLRLTLSDRMDSSPESDFESYISKHSQFPYHRAVPVSVIRQKSAPIPIIGSTTIKKTGSQLNLTTTEGGKAKRALRRRCESGPPGTTVEQFLKSATGATYLSQSAPAESQGFLQRLVPSFLKRKTIAPLLPKQKKTAAAIENLEMHGSGQFVCQVTRMSKSDKMESLMFMSMR